MNISMEQWGRDHWTTFHYVAIRCASHGGEIQRDKMRCDVGRHPHLAGGFAVLMSQVDTARYPTRLKGAEEVEDHDDWDCMDDMMAAGLFISTGTGMHPHYELTDLGWDVFRQISEYRGTRGAKVLDDWSPTLNRATP